MRDFLQDLKERNREERVRHYQYERKQEREKRWYRLRGSTVSLSQGFELQFFVCLLTSYWCYLISQSECHGN
jgi:hypothetical protein